MSARHRQVKKARLVLVGQRTEYEELHRAYMRVMGDMEARFGFYPLNVFDAAGHIKERILKLDRDIATHDAEYDRNGKPKAAP